MSKNIVTIGGGSGHAQVLKALKQIPEVVITAVCPSTDSGGSTGVLKEEYNGSSYTGDLTKCVAALSSNHELTEALMYRYQDGSLHNHSVRNLLFHALEQVNGTKMALSTMWRLCEIGPHRVMPVTTEKTELCATLQVGSTIVGETNVDNLAKNPLWSPDFHSITDIYLKPVVKVSDEVSQAMGVADYIVIAPGDLYSSILPVLLPTGMQSAIANSKAKIILILNIMTKRGETDNYTAEDFIKRIESKMGRSADYILFNDKPIPEEVLLKYSLERKVELTTSSSTTDLRLVPCALATLNEDQQLITDSAALKDVLGSIVNSA